VKRDDPKRLKLRIARNAASAKVEILCKGIAATLQNGYWLDMEELQPILDAVNIDLVEAIKAYEKATEAYQPYMSRRRVRTFRKSKVA
jgi:hypothetical protein